MLRFRKEKRSSPALEAGLLRFVSIKAGSHLAAQGALEPDGGELHGLGHAALLRGADHAVTRAEIWVGELELDGHALGELEVLHVLGVKHLHHDDILIRHRAEYRILLRQDDADMRLTEKSYQIGLAKQDRYDLLTEKREQRDAIISFAENYSVKPQYINSGLENLGTTPLSHGCKLIDLIPRPQVTLENIAELVPAFRAELDKVSVARKEEIIEAAEILIKYSGYIRREQIIADKINRLENIHIKGKFDYNSIQSLSTEARQKLTRIDPDTIAQASRIPGISPSDINILLVLLGR